MLDKRNKGYIYLIIDKYLSGDIDESVFCDEFYKSYDMQLDVDTLTEEESKAFSDLGSVVDRFSGFEEDHKNYPGGFYTKRDLKRKIVETKERLKLDENIYNEKKKQMPDPLVTKTAEILDEKWLMCPDCIDAWESTSEEAMVICPKCNQAFHNPRFPRISPPS